MDGSFCDICRKEIHSAHKGKLILMILFMKLISSFPHEFPDIGFVFNIKDDIGDKSVFTFNSLRDDEKKALIEKLEQQKTQY